jgi:amino acid adenylation domain-containing protein
MTINSRTFTTPEKNFIPFPHDFVDSTLVEQFEQAVEKFSDLTAIVQEDRKLTYHDLNQAANRLAHAILARLQPGEAPVVFIMDDKCAAVITILGILKAGRMYLGLEPSLPLEHLENIFKDAGPALVVSNTACLPLARQVTPTGISILNLDLLEGGFPDDNPHVLLSPASKAAVFYTSGSTGQPKGAVHDHRSALHFIWIKVNVLERVPGDQVPLSLSFSYGWSLDLIFGTLFSGATIHPCDLQKMTMGAFGDWLARQHITIVPCPVSFFRQWMTSLSGSAHMDLPDLRLLDTGGGKLISQDLVDWRKHFTSNCKLNYYYGSTEAGLLTIQKYDQNSDITDPVPPLGFATPDTQIILIDEAGQAVGQGREGEIIIKSRYMIPGYWHRPELTAAVFHPDPADPGLQIFYTGDVGRWLPNGMLEFLGRKDNQVKIRGYRVETDDVLSTLSSHPGVKDAYVAARPLPHALNEKRLVAYIVPGMGMHPTSADLRAYLTARLPGFMVPARFVFLEKFPLNPHSKVDASALPEPTRESDIPPIAPRNPVEEKLSKIWLDAFHFERIGVQDDFLELGGDSLLAMKILTDVEDQFDRKLPLAFLAECRTVEQMAQFLERSGNQVSSSLITFQPAGSRPPLFLFPGKHGDVFYFRDLACRLGDDQPVFGIELLLTGTKTVPSIRMEETAAGYLREIRELQPTGPYFLAGHSFGGMLAFEIALQLTSSGQTVAFLGMFDTLAPGSIPQADILERVDIHSQNLRRLVPGERLKYLRERAKSLSVKMARFTPFLYIAEKLKMIPKDLSWINQVAYLRYGPGSFPGKITLFRVNERPSYVLSDLTAGWKDYAAELEILDVPGTHASLLQEPHIDRLASEMKKSLLVAQKQAKERSG